MNARQEARLAPYRPASKLPIPKAPTWTFNKGSGDLVSTVISTLIGVISNHKYCYLFSLVTISPMNLQVHSKPKGPEHVGCAASTGGWILALLANAGLILAFWGLT